MDREALYARLPIALQNWAVTLESARLRRRRFNAEFRALLAQYQQRSYWTPEQVVAWRDQRLQRFVRHAAATVPHYRHLFRRLGIDAAQVRSLEDLENLPVLTKKDVQTDPSRFVSEAPTGASTTCRTSGSTGAGLRFTSSWRAHREQHAVWWRYFFWHGLELDTPRLYLGGRSVVPVQQRHPPFWRYSRVGRQILFSAYHLDFHNASAYLTEMRRSGVDWLQGYPSMVALLAKYALQRGERLSLRWVTLGGENLLLHQAEAIRNAFGVQPHNHYGMAEAVANISQCPNGILHVDEDFSAVEFVPSEGGQHRIVGTNFTNPTFPLLRYDTGDLAVLTGADCGCGRPGRVVDIIDGRREDYVVTRTGARLGRLDHIFKDLANVHEAQIRQSDPGRMTLYVVRGPHYGPGDEQRLLRETGKRVGGEVEFEIEYVETLPRTARGKLRFVVSESDRKHSKHERPARSGC